MRSMESQISLLLLLSHHGQGVTNRDYGDDDGYDDDDGDV